MTALVLDGKAIAGDLNIQTRQLVSEYTTRTGTAPGLATILVGDDPASQVYVANKRRSAAQVGIADFHRALPREASDAEIADTLSNLASDEKVSGILLQLPLPGGRDASGLIDLIPAHKDVDGLTTASAGLLARGMDGLRPCTPSGVIEILDYAGIDIAGKRAVVIGRSALVGSPVAKLLLMRNATVTVAHSRTKDLAAQTTQADIIVAAAGVPGLIAAEHVSPGAAVIDVGIHRGATGLTGDVRYEEVAATAGYITPVPGGVGPMTIAMLLKNTLLAARMAESLLYVGTQGADPV